MAKHSRKKGIGSNNNPRGNHSAPGKPASDKSSISENQDASKKIEPIIVPVKVEGEDNGSKSSASEKSEEQVKKTDESNSPDNDNDPVESLDSHNPTVVAPGVFQPELSEEDKEALAEKKRRHKKIGLIVAGAFAGLLILVYIAGILFFSTHFYPNTKIGSFDLSLKSQSEASQILSDGKDSYALSVNGQGLDLTLSGKEIGLTLDPNSVAEMALHDVALWKWPVEVFGVNDRSAHLTATYNKAEIAEVIKVRVNQFNATATQPVNAAIAYDITTKKFKVTSESVGTALDYASVMSVVDRAITTMNTRAELTQDELIQPMIFKTNPSLKKAVETADKMITADVVLMMAGFKVTELGPAKISTWVKLDEKLAATFDEAAFSAWIDEVTTGCNTVGGKRTYTRPDGKVVTVSGGTYGWQTDSDALRTSIKNSVAAGYVGTLEVPVLHSGSGFSGLGDKDWGSRYCDIDISEQHARFYDAAGVLIWETDIITGNPDGRHNTPTGVYVVNSKASPSKLIGSIDPETKKPEYETTVSYWMPFVGNAIGLHDATWQPSFGGSMYKYGYGSHGCVNLPYSAAQSLYGIIQVGDVVVTHY